MDVLDQLKKILQAGYKANPVKTATERIHVARLRGRRVLKDAKDALQHEWDIGAKIHVRYCLAFQVLLLLDKAMRAVAYVLHRLLLRKPLPLRCDCSDDTKTKWPAAPALLARNIAVAGCFENLQSLPPFRVHRMRCIVIDEWAGDFMHASACLSFRKCCRLQRSRQDAPARKYAIPSDELISDAMAAQKTALKRCCLRRWV